MLEFAGSRELIELEVAGARVRGTVHHPRGVRHPWGEDRNAAKARNGRLAVLIVNSLGMPRTATGDSSVYWAESIAASGYAAIRIDLPGLGDSDGDASTGLLDLINSGGYASAAISIAKQLTSLRGYSGYVMMGHCAGSVTAVYAAAEAKECKGLILMDPYFYLPAATRPEVRKKLSEWARSNAMGRLLSDLYDRAKQLRLKLRRGVLPGNANTALLSRWKQVAGTGLPILIFKAPGIKAVGAKPRTGEFDYMQHAMKLAGRKSRVELKVIESADHSFANRAGREAIRQLIEGWMKDHFSLASAERIALSTSSRIETDKQRLAGTVLMAQAGQG